MVKINDEVLSDSYKRMRKTIKGEIKSIEFVKSSEKTKNGERISIYNVKFERGNEWYVGIEKNGVFNLISEIGFDDWTIMFYNGLCKKYNVKDI